MLRLLIRLAVFVGSAALGLFVTSLLVDGFVISARGFIVTVIVFAILQSLFTPILSRLFRTRANALVGGVGLISTFLSLVVAHFFTNGVRITGLTSWLLATLLVWAFTALAALLLPMLFVKRKAADRRTGDSAGSASKA
jgi:hypothetical protein